MSKKLLFRVLGLLAVLLVAILWLVSIINQDLFGSFKLSYAIAIICGVWAIIYLLSGIFTKTNTISKKGNFIMASIFGVIAVITACLSIGVSDRIVAPIVLITLVAIALISVIFTGGNSWNEGDNQKVGYKNYYERKKEEENKKEDE